MEQKEFPFSILREDYENSGKSYLWAQNCPATIAMARQFPNLPKASVTDKEVRTFGVEYSSLAAGNVIGTVEKTWDSSTFDALKNEGIEFHTTIKFV